MNDHQSASFSCTESMALNAARASEQIRGAYF
jgi:hypothetical protein